LLSHPEHCFDANDIFRHTHPNGPYTYFYLCLALIISSIAWLLLAWFVASFFPGKYGTPVNIAELFGRNSEEKVAPDIEAARMTDGKNRKLEPVGDGQPLVVRITNLCKVFKSLLHPPNMVVRDFSLNIYKNQITVLLGHNGAGKTTTMCMLTGMMSRSSGTIVVDGSTSVKTYRSLIGFCPQHNSFIPYLTCSEHLLFFGQLRGLSVLEARKQAKQIFDEINLTEKADMPAHTLSGGMQRRLSLANAIIGETKLLVLDEPSSGLDPESRRELWDVLLRLKKTNSILVTTHYMEEADVLGDKIAIMENGEVIAYGTSLFLKREYGNGYTLKLLKGDKTTFPSGRVLDLIRDTIPGAKVKESVDSLMCVVLPYEDQRDYVRVLEQLEARQHELGIESIGITNTTLEEVFLK
jgi:ATP-binding cassette, subfamily A (ABC1), member 3